MTIILSTKYFNKQIDHKKMTVYYVHIKKTEVDYGREAVDSVGAQLLGAIERYHGSISHDYTRHRDGPITPVISINIPGAKPKTLDEELMKLGFVERIEKSPYSLPM